MLVCRLGQVANILCDSLVNLAHTSSDTQGSREHPMGDIPWP